MIKCGKVLVEKYSFGQGSLNKQKKEFGKLF
jgi:hypothetical protein